MVSKKWSKACLSMLILLSQSIFAATSSFAQEAADLSQEEVRILNAEDLGIKGRDSLYDHGVPRSLETRVSGNSEIVESSTVTEEVYGISEMPDATVTDEVYGMGEMVQIQGANQFVLYQGIYPEKYGQWSNGNYRNIAATTLLDGRVFMSGGEDGSYVTSGAWVYNPANHTFTRVASMPRATGSHHTITLPNGKVFITGGYDVRYQNGITDSYLYDPSTNGYTKVANAPFSTEAATLLKDGRVMIIVRNSSSFTGGAPSGSSAVAIYNPTLNNWIQAAPLPEYGTYSRYRMSTLDDGRVMLSGSSGGGQYFSYLYDPAANNWTKMGITAISPDNQVTLKDGRVLMIRSQNLYIYDPSVNILSLLPFTLTNYATNANATVLNDGRILTIGGTRDFGYVAGDLGIITVNNMPRVTVIPGNQTVYPITGNPLITISGTVADPDNEPVTISATISGVTKSTVVSGTSSSPAWQIQWNSLTDQIPHGTYSNIQINVTDGYETSTSLYNGTILVDYNQPPSEPTVQNPSSSSSSTPSIVSGTNVTITWNFNDPDSGDHQSAYEVDIYQTSNGAKILGTGWVNSSVSSYQVPNGRLTAGNSYYVMVRVKDNKGGISPYSASKFLQVNRKPTALFTSHTNGQQVNENVLGFTWNYSDVDGQTQQAYQIMGSTDSWTTIHYNSGIIQSSISSHTTIPLASGSWDFRVLVSDGLDWSDPVNLNLVLPNSLEPNDSFESAFPIQYNTPMNSIINSSTDRDFFRYVANNSGIDRFNLNVPNDLNYDVHVYDSTRKLIASGLRGFGWQESIIFEVAAGQQYYIEILGVNGDHSLTAEYTGTVTHMNYPNTVEYYYDSNGNLTSKVTIGQ